MNDWKTFYDPQGRCLNNSFALNQPLTLFSVLKFLGQKCEFALSVFAQLRSLFCFVSLVYTLGNVYEEELWPHNATHSIS